MDAEKNWRCPPNKVRTVEGEVLYFVKCERPRKQVETGIVENASVARINAHLRLYSQINGGEDASVGGLRIPKLQGIVVSDANTRQEDSAASKTETLPSVGTQKQEQETGDQSHCLLESC